VTASPIVGLPSIGLMGDKAAERAAIRDFLLTRRARITPAQAGLQSYGSNRRVKGLRREEVAMLAGISAEYYTRLERGDATRASPSVLEAVANALQLDQAEREHLAHLVHAADPEQRPRHPRRQHLRQATVRPAVQLLLDSISDLPAFVFNKRMDILACNRLGRLLYAPMFDDPVRPANTARFAFLAGERAKQFWPQWDDLADNAVAVLHAEAGRDPHHPGLVELVGQLSTGSEEFRVRWAAHNVRHHGSGSKSLHHPVVGTLTMPYEHLYLADDSDQYLMVYTPQPGTPAHDSLKLLASWGYADVDRAAAEPLAGDQASNKEPPTQQ
jgi:transcriptional regulator with XRE-family HTH domain